MKRPFELVSEIQDKDAEIARLKKLLLRAVAALEKWNVRDRFSELIRELRNAAQ
jgi:hypothetical protein